MKIALPKFNIEYLLSTYLVVLFGLDILNKFELFEELPWSIFVKFGKFAFFFIFLWILIKYTKNQTKHVLILLTCFFVISSSIPLLTNFSIENLKAISPNIRLFTLYLFPLIFSGFLLNFKDEKYPLLEKIYIGIIIIVSISVLIGFVTEFRFLKTYVTRFGFVGLMPKSITASYFFISSIIFTYYLGFIKQKSKWIFALVFLTSFLVGTKAIYLFNLLLIGFHAFYFKWYKSYYFYGLGLISLIGIFMFQNKIIEFLWTYFTSFMKLYEAKGLVTALTSFRDLIFINNKDLYLEKWNWWNYLIGGKIPNAKLFESSIWDLIVFFGVIGVCLYVYVLSENIFKFYSKSNYFSNFSIFSVFLISILAGQFFINISGISYFLITLFLIRSSNKVKSI